MAERARRSVGATIAACSAAFTNGVAANIAGGTHHAYADRGGGFCVFNDAAVAARLMQAEWARSRAPAAEGRRSSTSTFTRATARPASSATTRVCSRSHCTAQKNFPFRKEASDLDVDLPDGCGDDDYLHALERALDELGAALRARPRHLSGRRRPARGRPPRAPEAHLGRPGSARPARVRLGLAARACRWRSRWRAAMATRIEDTVQAQVNTFKVAAQYARALAESRRDERRSYPTSPQPAARAELPRIPHHRHPLDGQRRLRPRQQRRLLQLVRHGGQCPPDRAGRAGHPPRRSYRPGDRDPVQLLLVDRVSADGGSGPARRAHRPLQRALRGRAVRPRRAADGRQGPFRPCVCGPRNAPARGVARQAQIRPGGPK